MEYTIINRNGSLIGRGKAETRWWALGDHIEVMGTVGRISRIINHLQANAIIVTIIVEPA